MARSRRARQRRKKTHGAGPGRWAARAVGGVLVLGVIATLGGYFWLQNFLRSERFRTLVNEKVSERLEVDASFNQFEWDGMEVSVPEFRARGDQLIRRIDLDGLDTEVKFAPLLSRKIESQEVRVRRLEVEVDVTKDGPTVESGSEGAFSFTGARIDELVGMVDFGSSALKWDGMKATVTPGTGKGTYDATLSRGRLLTPLGLFPELGLQEASIRYGDQALFLKRGDWKVFESGRLATDGEMDFASGRYFVNAHLTRVQCEEVLPDNWQKRLRGELSSDFSVQGKGKSAPVITGSLALSRGQLTALPVLDRIAAYTATERFRRLSLRKANLDFRQEGQRLELTKIEIASEGLLRMDGWLTIDDGQLEGEFQLGLTPTTLARIPGAAERVFVPGQDGMHWSPVRISGTTLLPKEDLSERLIAAGFEWMYEMVGGQLVLKESGKVAGSLAKGLWATAGEAGKIGVDIVGRGADLLNDAGLPNPVETVREGVGGIFNSILGTPQRGAPDSPADVKPKTGKELLQDEEQKVLDRNKDKTKEREGDSEQKAKDGANETIEQQEGESLDEKLKKLVDDELGVE